ncbi:MAG: hypothetical protein ABW042_03325 [Phenylobacterium sp.]
MSDDFVGHVERGIAAAHALRLDEAIGCYLAALRLRPDNAPVIAGLGLVLLAKGDYEAGFAFYEARKLFDQDRIGGAGLPEWAGEPLDGRSLLVWAEQGLGDEIQMARYIPRLRGLGDVRLVASPPLHRLFGQLGVPLIGRDEAAPVPSADLYVRNLSLPAVLKTSLETIPAAPYLTAPAGPKRGGIGFVWRGNPEHPNDARRSLPSPALLDPLREAAELVDLQTPQGDFLDTAARIQALDLVITVDTAMAHLAGALGAPCWVMLPSYRTDWRWMTGRADSPWYPSLRLYRQEQPGDWTGVVARMRADLAAGLQDRR